MADYGLMGQYSSLSACAPPIRECIGRCCPGVPTPRCLDMGRARGLATNLDIYCIEMNFFRWHLKPGPDSDRPSANKDKEGQEGHAILMSRSPPHAHTLCCLVWCWPQVPSRACPQGSTQRRGGVRGEPLRPSPGRTSRPRGYRVLIEVVLQVKVAWRVKGWSRRSCQLSAYAMPVNVSLDQGSDGQ